jgi:hypothetical protein
MAGMKNAVLERLAQDLNNAAVAWNASNRELTRSSGNSMTQAVGTLRTYRDRPE